MTMILQNAMSETVNRDRAGELPVARLTGTDAALREHATPVRVRRRQRLALDQPTPDTVYIVRSGLLGIEAAIAGKPRQLLELFYPGDIIRRSNMPPLPHATLTALNVSEVWRLPARGFEALLTANADQNASMQRRLGEQHARASLHASIIGALSGDERFASLLIELGLRIGLRGAAGIGIDNPLSRTDIADYLALNPDTLSRITSRFRARGLLIHLGSGQILLPNWEELCAASPIATTLQALHTPTLG
ncbi:Crp/Fnr family transcriptional regulator [Hyphomicrobium sulfonivorans]|uniref:Crp/Fnr family transcriptional regulator n=2 Tax=Hyphomicrobium sulfonivorans TaxID=121290 RepID=UPI0018E13A63|nr:Crp/Fnr family transcriptional regulator [Hyphomicrobium sulfonivorans]MBI1650174.1 Crp/Fnr family transcriptional regulator [Hyphomicrobium sulfonivorans]NSL73090.1 hypothetical protein [Hyphomicrobium sulfonivorans]